MKEVTYDGASRVAQIKYSKDTRILIQIDYEFDEAGNITSRTETRAGRKPVEYRYFYDELNRLIRVDINGIMVSRYEYDAVGNRLLKEFVVNRFAGGNNGGYGGFYAPVGLSGKPVYDIIKSQYDAANQIISAGDTGFRHDKNGNMIEIISPSDGFDSSGNPVSTVHEYNRANRLYKIINPDGNSRTYYYDSDGLITKEIPLTGADGGRAESPRKYYWDMSKIPTLLSEKDQNNNPTSSFIYNGITPVLAKFTEPGMSSLAEAKNKYCLTDHLGSILALADEKGVITDENDYDEYGIPLFERGKTGNPLGFTGERQLDNPGNMIYLRNRYYNTSLGRFLRNDPLNAGAVQDYVYTGNNPVNRIDPLGFQALPITTEPVPHPTPGPTPGYELPDICYEGKEITQADIDKCFYKCLAETNPALAGLLINGISFSVVLLQGIKNGATVAELAEAAEGLGVLAATYAVFGSLTCLGICANNPFYY